MVAGPAHGVFMSGPNGKAH